MIHHAGGTTRLRGSNVRVDIAEDIIRLLDDGTQLSEILVVDDSAWGDVCASTRADIDELIEHWQSTGSDNGASADDLQSAADWLEMSEGQTT